jgi:hypothetical protein
MRLNDANDHLRYPTLCWDGWFDECQSFVHELLLSQPGRCSVKITLRIPERFMNENVADRPLPDIRKVPLMTLVHEGTGLDRSMSDIDATSSFLSSI